MPFCTKCGKLLTGNAKFCTNCGALTSQTEKFTQPSIRQSYTQPVMAASKSVRPDETFNAFSKFFSKYKIMIASVVLLVIIAIVAYVLFLKPDPEKDGRNIGSLICSCREDSAKNGHALHKQFRDEFVSKQYKTRAEAKNIFNTIGVNKQLKYDSCYNEALNKFRVKAQKYNKSTAQSQKFESAFYSKQNSCNLLSSTELSVVQLEILKKINAIIDPEPDVEKIKNDLIGNSIMGWTFDYLNEFQKCTIANKTKGSDRIEYLINLKLAHQNESFPHDASVTVVYSQSDDGWSLTGVKCNSITYTYQALVGGWQTIPILPDATCMISNEKKYWIKDGDYGQQYKGGGDDGETFTLTSQTISIASRELEPINLVFTFYPKQ